MFLQNLYFYRKAALRGCRKFLFSANKKGRPRSTKSTACPKIRRHFKEAVYPPPQNIHCIVNIMRLFHIPPPILFCNILSYSPEFVKIQYFII